MIRKDWNFCDQILKALAILDAKLKNFIFNFNSSFLQNNFTLIFNLVVTLEKCQIY